MQKAHVLLGQTGSALARIAAQLHVLRAWQGALAKWLPPELAARCQVTRVQGGALHILVSSGAISTRLRQQAPTLLKLLQQMDLADAASLQQLHIKVQPALFSASKRRPSQAQLPRNALLTLTETARNLPEGPLRTALAKMIRHHKSP